MPIGNAIIVSEYGAMITDVAVTCWRLAKGCYVKVPTRPLLDCHIGGRYNLALPAHPILRKL